MNKIRITVFIYLIGSAALSLKADVYDYHPSSSLHLGGGYDPAEPTQPYVRPCLQYSTDRNIDVNQNGQASAHYTLEVISSRSQLYQAMHISASADASYGFFSASGSVDAQNDFSSTDDSLTWIAQVEIIYGRFQPVNPQPIPEVSHLRTADIRTRCGTELVTQETRAVLGTIIYTFRNLSTTQKNDLSVAISASASWFSGGGSATADYKQAMEKASRESQLSMDVAVRGGPGRDALASIVKADSDLPQIRAALQTYITDSNEGNAAAIQYETSNISQFYPRAGTPNLASGQEVAIASLYSTYKDLSDVVARIQSLTIVPVRPEDQYLNTFVTSAQRTTLGSLQGQYVHAMSDIRDQATKCLRASSSCHPYDVSNLPRVDWPKMPAMPEIVVNQICVGIVVYPVGYKFKAGEQLGTVIVDAYVTGDPQLLDRVVIVERGNPRPANLGEVHTGPGIGPGVGCRAFNPDTSRAFKRFWTDAPDFAKTDLSLVLQLYDKFGRVSYFHVQPPNYYPQAR
jgi:hypothetical protein